MESIIAVSCGACLAASHESALSMLMIGMGLTTIPQPPEALPMCYQAAVEVPRSDPPGMGAAGCMT